jgi:hypothetical protein
MGRKKLEPEKKVEGITVYVSKEKIDLLGGKAELRKKITEYIQSLNPQHQ